VALPRPKLRIEDVRPDGVWPVTFEGVEIAGRGTYDVDIDVAELNGVLECVALAVRAPSGRRVDGEIIRKVRVAELVRAAATWIEGSELFKMTAAAIEGAAVPGFVGLGNQGSGTREMLSEEDRGWYAQLPHAKEARDEATRFRRMVREAARAGGATRVAAAAEIYKRAARRGDPPTKAVEVELRVSRNAAIGLVRRARAAGLLPNTSKGRAASGGPGKGSK
jgi:hypothetical protein